MMPTRSREAADISTFCLRRFSDTTLPRCCDLIEQLHRLLPGILLCVAITGVAILLQARL
jgi:hypothetical protein